MKISDSKYVYFLFLLILLSCKSEDHTAHADQHHHHTPISENQTDNSNVETIAMAEELQTLYAAMDPMKSFYNNVERSQLMKSKLTTVTDIGQKLSITIKTAYELVLAGKNQEALTLYNQTYDQILGLEVKNKQTILNTILSQRAMTHFRIGEQENCQNNHNESSCLLPFEPKSYYELKAGSTQAINDILKVLETSKDDNLIWLLNVAYMTLGEYPQKVP